MLEQQKSGYWCRASKSGAICPYGPELVPLVCVNFCAFVCVRACVMREPGRSVSCETALLSCVGFLRLHTHTHTLGKVHTQSPLCEKRSLSFFGVLHWWFSTGKSMMQGAKPASLFVPFFRGSLTVKWDMFLCVCARVLVYFRSRKIEQRMRAWWCKFLAQYYCCDSGAGVLGHDCQMKGVCVCVCVRCLPIQQRWLSPKSVLFWPDLVYTSEGERASGASGGVKGEAAGSFPPQLSVWVRNDAVCSWMWE